MSIFKSLMKQFDKDSDLAVKDEVAAMLKTDPEKLKAFEEAYRRSILETPEPPDNFFEVNAKQAAEWNRQRTDIKDLEEEANRLIGRIADELVAATPVLHIKDGATCEELPKALPDKTPAVTTEEIEALPAELAPQLTGTRMRVDLRQDEPPYRHLLFLYRKYLEEKDARAKRQLYGQFRAGLDLLDLDPVMYAMLGKNRNSMSFWLPKIAGAAAKEGFFKIPETRIARVPLPLLQMSRLDYAELTPSTLKIADDWAYRVFKLDEAKTYFIKTGTYSSKYDFRNAKVTSPKEVRELGEYLLFIQHQASMMAGPLIQPHPIYGVSTTNEWVVREYIEDREGNPAIYKGLPLHTEYRIFVDFDTREVLGCSPYWEPETMKKRFSRMDDADSPHQRHDYVIYKMHEETLMRRYHENVETVLSHVEKLIPDVALEGQWSVDIMQNGNDFYMIDMAAADTSALNECIPKGRLKKQTEDWLPDIADIQEKIPGDPG